MNFFGRLAGLLVSKNEKLIYNLVLKRKAVMTAPLSKRWQNPIEDAQKSDVRTQFAALCYRTNKEKLQFLLITSRERGRWIVPKGWPIADQEAPDAVMTEAWEEAGVRGVVDPRPIGLFSYMKEYADRPNLPCMAMVYAVEVSGLARSYPERSERERKWVSRKKATSMVDEPELARIISEFDPNELAG